LAMSVQSAADALIAGEGADSIHQAALQQFLWWSLPRRYPDDSWAEMAEATAELLEELGEIRLAEIARSPRTSTILHLWATEPEEGAKAFRSAHGTSGVEPPSTAILAWGSVMGLDEARALESVERALGEAISSGELSPGKSRWRSAAAAITDRVLTAPHDFPPGQNWVNLVTTERIVNWIASARHPKLGEWRSSVANQLLAPTAPPPRPDVEIAPFLWLLELAATPQGAELTQSNYLARASVVSAVARFGWWDWPKAPRSEAEVHELACLRAVATRLRLVRRQGRRLHLTARGAQMLANPADLWAAVASQTEDGDDFTFVMTEMVALRLIRGLAEPDEIVADVTPILRAQGWTTTSGPITEDQVARALWAPLRWWRLFSVLDEVKPTWERGTGRRLTVHTIALRSEGERMVLAYLRSRAAGPRHSVYT
jgi:hypothetical protein